MIISDSKSCAPAFKRYIVSTNDAAEHDKMVDILATLPLKWYDDYIITDTSIYFGKEEDRTLFLLAFQ